MAEMKLDPMDADTFLAWATGQDERYELVDGLPRMMAGAKARHDEIVVSALLALGPKLRGGPCRPYSGDFAVRVPNGNVRRPDVTVDCRGDDPDRMSAAEPVLVMKVFSPSTRSSDLFRKVSEYQGTPTILYILLVEPAEMLVIFHHREPGGAWTSLTLIGPDTDIPMPALGITIKLSDLYE